MFEKLTDKIRALVDAQAVYLFGSQAKGTAREDSDIDICVVAPTASKRNTLEMCIRDRSEADVSAVFSPFPLEDNKATSTHSSNGRSPSIIPENSSRLAFFLRQMFLVSLPCATMDLMAFYFTISRTSIGMQTIQRLSLIHI